MFRHYNKKIETLERHYLAPWSHIVSIVGFPILIFTIMLAFYQIKELDRVVSAQNNVALSSEFFNDTNTGIIDAMENNRTILVENKGKFNDAQLDNYLGDFETIDDVYREGLLTPDELCVSFSYYVQLTNKNVEIQSYIATQRKQDTGLFGGFVDLTHIVASTADGNCLE